MENLISLIGKRINVETIITQSWQSQRFIRNGILSGITQSGIPIVSIDDKSDHYIGFTGGYLHSDGYKITSV